MDGWNNVTLNIPHLSRIKLSFVVQSSSPVLQSTAVNIMYTSKYLIQDYKTE